MQPYFAPYAGYFRLFAAADLFVIYDCVQFPRRGWVHRNRLPLHSGALDWLTLPLKKSVRETVIRDIAFSSGARERFDSEAKRFPALDAHGPLGWLNDPLRDFSVDPVDYIERLLQACNIALNLPYNTIRSSTFGVETHIRGEERIIEILRRTGATQYVNSPGGRALYRPARFAETGIQLAFLGEYDAPSASILHRLATEPTAVLRREILARCELGS